MKFSHITFFLIQVIFYAAFAFPTSAIAEEARSVPIRTVSSVLQTGQAVMITDEDESVFFMVFDDLSRVTKYLAIEESQMNASLTGIFEIKYLAGYGPLSNALLDAIRNAFPYLPTNWNPSENV